MTTAVIFDVDGVLVRSKPFTYALEAEHGIPKEHFAAFFKTRFPLCIIGKSDLKEAIAETLEHTQWGGSVDAFLDFWFKSEDQPDLRLQEEVQKLRNRNYLVCVATNQERHRTHYLRETMGMDSAFDYVFPSCEIGFAKPSEEFYKRVTETLRQRGVDNMVFFDDSAANVDAAAHHGWDAHLYRNIEDYHLWTHNRPDLAIS